MSFFKSGQVDPVSAEAIWPWMKEPFGDWLFSGMTQKPDGGWDLEGVEKYPGQLNVDIPGQTRLPEVWNNWQPWDAGNSYLATKMADGTFSPGKDPGLEKMWSWGGLEGPGHKGMQSMINYGAAGQGGQYASNMAQYGVSSEGAGRPLADMAYGRPTGAGSYLAAFLNPNKYQAPAINMQPVTRKA